MYITKQEVTMASKRTIITLSEKDKLWLEGYSKAYKISLAEAIRKGVKKLREADGLKTYHTLVERTRGIWRKGDGLKYQRKLRSEWNSK
jgi:hypothetical protein